MKKLLYIATLFVGAVIVMSSCNDNDDTWSEYQTWRINNYNWYIEQSQRTNPNGTKYFQELSPSWYPNSGVLIHYFNDRTQTEGNLSPMSTSQVSVKYKGQLYNGVTFDSTTVDTDDSVRTFSLDKVIDGWKIALTDMRVGDTCEIILPYAVGYGIQGSTSIYPYSVLRFGIKLTDIPEYEIP